MTTSADYADAVAVLRDQWHDLVRADNLLGPRAALGLVRQQITVVESLLPAIRGGLRTDLVSLAAQYAESAAWLFEDSGEHDAAQRWTSRAIEWAYEADDKIMLAWTMYRRSQQATAEWAGAHAVSLARAALRHEPDLPLRMRAAITVQQAHGHALDGDVRTAHHLLDRAHTWAADDTAGDARGGHGSFCTPEYIEVNRADCLLTLRQPHQAVPILENAIPRISAVYQRDKAAALSRAARAYAAVGAVEQAAVSAYAALPVAQGGGSARIALQLHEVAQQLAPYRKLPAVRDLLDRVHDARPA